MVSNCSYPEHWVEDSWDNRNASSSLMDISPEMDFACGLYDFLVETVVMGALCAFGFVGNLLSAVCLWKDKSKTATPFLLISLALADTLFLATALLLRVVTSVHTFAGSLASMDSLTSYIGKYVYPLAMVANTGTIYVTVLVTVNRYISVCKPYDASSLCSIPIARKQVVVVWLFSILYNVPRFFEFQVIEYYAPYGPPEECQFWTEMRPEPTELRENRVYKVVYLNALYSVIIFLGPLISLAVLNYNLIMALRETRRKRELMKNRRLGCHGNDLGQNSLSSSVAVVSSSTSSSSSEDDITLMLIVVVVIFVVTQSPALLTQILTQLLDDNCPSVFFFYQRISDLLVVVNSSVNFIAYCFCSRRFRRILLSLLRGRSSSDPETAGGGGGGGVGGGGEVAPEATVQTAFEEPATPTAVAVVRCGRRRRAGDGRSNGEGAAAFLGRLINRGVARSNNGLEMNEACVELKETRRQAAE